VTFGDAAVSRFMTGRLTPPHFFTTRSVSVRRSGSPPSGSTRPMRQRRKAASRLGHLGLLARDICGRSRRSLENPNIRRLRRARFR
jgi:hypothetical protein